MFYYYPVKSMIRLLHTKHNYHLVFSNKIGYNKCCHIIEVLAELDVINKDYVNIRHMRQDMTLRVSPVVNVREVKKAPVIVDLLKNNKVSHIDNGIELYKILHQIFC